MRVLKLSWIVTMSLFLSLCSVPRHPPSENVLLARHNNRGIYYMRDNKIRFWLRSENGSQKHVGRIESISDSTITITGQPIPIRDIWFIKRRNKLNLDKWTSEVVEYGELVEIVNNF